MNQPQPPQKPGLPRRVLTFIYPWLGLALVAAGVWGRFTWCHAAIAAGAYMLADGWYAVWILSRVRRFAPDGTTR